MPRLIALGLSMLALAAAAQTAPTVGTRRFEYGIGEILVSGQCAAPSDLSSQKLQQRALVWRQGRAEVMAVLYTQRPVDDRQAEQHLRGCARGSGARVSAETLAALDSAAETAVQQAIQACLQQQSSSVRVRTVSLRRGSVRCSG